MDDVPEFDAKIKLESLKHNQSLHRRWENNKVLYADEHVIIGANNRTEVVEGTGNSWRTRAPALFYFDDRKWFNIIYLFKETRPFYYCNLISPFTLNGNTVQFIDYDIDFIVQPDYSYSIVDLDEYEENKERYKYPKSVQRKLKEAESELKKWIKQHRDPFNQRYLKHWYYKMDKVMN